MIKKLGLVSIASVGLLISPLTIAASLDAKVEWAERVSLSVPVSGIVSQVTVETGQNIKPGQILLRLDQDPFKTALQEAKAKKSQAASNRYEARRDLKQTKELYERGLISNVELENAQLKSDRSNAAWDVARATVSTAKYKLAHSQIVAPFDGWVLQRKVEIGQSIISTLQAQILLVVAASNSYIARTRVPGNEMTKLKRGTDVKVKVGSKIYKGKVWQLGLEPVRPRTGRTAFYELGVKFNSEGRLLRAGQNAEIKF